MFFTLSKILFYLLMPITWIVGVFVYALFTKKEKRRKTFLKIGIVLIFVLSNDFLINEMYGLWEVRVTPFAEIKEPYEVGIVLTGITDSGKPVKDRAYFGKGVDRIIHAMQLYKLGKIKYILITGASPQAMGNPNPNEPSETENLQKFLIMCGVPQKAIILELNARNTRENAIYSTKILKEKFPDKKFLLITSAFHMNRAEGCFRKAGLDITPFSTDLTYHERQFGLSAFIPSEYALSKWYTLTHEILGFLVYKVMGYA